MKVKKDKFLSEYKEENTQLPPIRVSRKFKKELEIEAEEYGHSLTGYIRWLIDRGRKSLNKKV